MLFNNIIVTKLQLNGTFSTTSHVITINIPLTLIAAYFLIYRASEYHKYSTKRNNINAYLKRSSIHLVLAELKYFPSKNASVVGYECIGVAAVKELKLSSLAIRGLCLLIRLAIFSVSLTQASS